MATSTALLFAVCFEWEGNIRNEASVLLSVLMGCSPLLGNAARHSDAFT